MNSTISGLFIAWNRQPLPLAITNSRDRAALDKFFSGHGLLDHLVIATGGAKGLGDFSGLSFGVLEEGVGEKFCPQLETLQAALSFINAGGGVTVITVYG